MLAAPTADSLEAPQPLQEGGARPDGGGSSLQQAFIAEGGRMQQQALAADAEGGGGGIATADVAVAAEQGEEHQEQAVPVPPWRWWLALAYVCYHVFFIFCVVSMSVEPKGKLVLTLLLLPVVVYQTAWHWCSGTYFPLTKADDIYILRFRRKIDKNPLQISAGTIFSMVWMGIFFSVITLVDFIRSCQAYCINDRQGLCSQAFDELSFEEQWSIRLRFVFYLFYILIAAKRFVLTLVFTLSLIFITAGLSAVTCGYGCCLMCVFLIRPFTRDSEFLCIPCEYVYRYVSFFYRHI